jgi:uncharacterized membrane protein
MADKIQEHTQGQISMPTSAQAPTVGATASRIATPMANRRLAYIDWMRGLACLLMFQTHCYDSWLRPEARTGSLFRWSQLLGTGPAPIFLFLCGVSFALVTERLWEKGIDRDTIARQTIWRGFEIYLAGVLFRLQEYVLGYPHAPWTDLLRVDVLNILGIAMMLMGAVCWLATSQRVSVSRLSSAISALVLATVAAMVTPVLYTTHRLQFLPWPIESYIDGVHTFHAPPSPVWPWDFSCLRNLRSAMSAAPSSASAPLACSVARWRCFSTGFRSRYTLSTIIGTPARSSCCCAPESCCCSCWPRMRGAAGDWRSAASVP